MSSGHWDRFYSYILYFVKKLGLEIKPCVNNNPLFSANGALLRIAGVADVTFYLKGLRIPHTFRVGFMTANKGPVNYIDGTVRFYSRV